jgi:hypothetical protein
MADINELLKEAEKLGILNIDVNGYQLSEEDIQIAINATKRMNSKLNYDRIAQKISEAERNCPDPTTALF